MARWKISERNLGGGNIYWRAPSAEATTNYRICLAAKAAQNEMQRTIDCEDCDYKEANFTEQQDC